MDMTDCYISLLELVYLSISAHVLPLFLQRMFNWARENVRSSSAANFVRVAGSNVPTVI
jgi:hypothetical protein